MAHHTDLILSAVAPINGSIGTALSTPSPNQVVQLTGAALILLAYLFLHLGRTGPRKPSYLIPNCVGAGLLAFEAARTAQYGFLALEGTWSLISFVVWIRVLAQRDSADH